MVAQVARLERLCVFNYQGSASTAITLIAKFGRTIQHVSIAEGSYNPETSSNEIVETSADVYSCDFALDDSKYKEGLIQSGDRYALIGQFTGVIDLSDKLVIDGVRWNIVNVQKLAPAGVVVLWWVHIRK
jgi:hypothetical protein